MELVLCRGEVTDEDMMKAYHNRMGHGCWSACPVDNALGRITGAMHRCFCHDGKVSINGVGPAGHHYCGRIDHDHFLDLRSKFEQGAKVASFEFWYSKEQAWRSMGYGSFQAEIVAAPINLARTQTTQPAENPGQED